MRSVEVLPHHSDRVTERGIEPEQGCGPLGHLHEQRAARNVSVDEGLVAEGFQDMPHIRL
jgi:hypothetical protein